MEDDRYYLLVRTYLPEEALRDGRPVFRTRSNLYLSLSAATHEVEHIMMRLDKDGRDLDARHITYKIEIFEVVRTYSAKHVTNINELPDNATVLEY